MTSQQITAYGGFFYIWEYIGPIVRITHQGNERDTLTRCWFAKHIIYTTEHVFVFC